MLKKYAKQFGVTFVLFLGLDFVWLTQVSPKFYQAHIPHLLAPSPDLLAALLFYLSYISGLVFFAVRPASLSYQWKAAFGRGAFFGFVCYATFDLTNQAVLRDWPVVVTAVDLIWGTLLSGVVTLFAAKFR